LTTAAIRPIAPGRNRSRSGSRRPPRHPPSDGQQSEAAREAATAGPPRTVRCKARRVFGQSSSIKTVDTAVPRVRDTKADVVPINSRRPSVVQISRVDDNRRRAARPRTN
jgi:hypothetical protein